MEYLSAKTVFHEIKYVIVKEDDEDEFGKDIILQNESDIENEEETEIQTLDSEEEWDTDLEEERSYTTRRSFIQEDHARQVYLAACKQLNIVPANCFIKGIDTTTMNLNFQGLGPLGIKAVATGLVMDRTITNLYLAGNFISCDGVRYLAEMLRENEYITHLDLSENDINSNGAKMISELFKENDTLTVLNISGNRIKGQDAEYIAEILAIPHYIGLRSLDVSHNELGDVGATIIGHVIGDNETLTHLNLSWNQIRKAGIRCISKGLAENNSLLVLNLSYNGVDGEAAEMLGKAMINNRKLEELNLNSNRVGLDGIAALFKHIGKNENLKSIKLTNNPITLQGPVAALKLLQQSDASVLDELEIADACVPREFFSVLEEVQALRPQFKVHMGGFMDSKDMCKAEIKTNQNAWMKEPILVFITFIDERKYKLLDMFKSFDSDKSCTLSRKEFKTGLMRVGCPLKENQLDQLINTLDIDNNGEIDIEEFLDGFDKHKRRLNKYSKFGNNSRVSSANTKRFSSRPSSGASSMPPSRPQSNTRPPSRPQSNTRPPSRPQSNTSPPSRPQSKTRSMSRPQSKTRPSNETELNDMDNLGMNVNQKSLPDLPMSQRDMSHLQLPEQPPLVTTSYNTAQENQDLILTVPRNATTVT